MSSTERGREPDDSETANHTQLNQAVKFDLTLL